MTMKGAGRVLVVDDDPQVRNLFETFLDDRYVVTSASSGEEALAKISEETDVVLLDRLMPGLSGSDVLKRIRAQEYDCRVAMVTAVDPDLSVVEMGFDDYLIKPVSKSELHNVVDSLLNWETYDDVLKRYFNMARKVAVLEDEFPPETLEASDEYKRLLRTLDSLQTEADEAIDSLDTADFDQIASRIDVPAGEGQLES